MPNNTSLILIGCFFSVLEQRKVSGMFSGTILFEMEVKVCGITEALLALRSQNQPIFCLCFQKKVLLEASCIDLSCDATCTLLRNTRL